MFNNDKSNIQYVPKGLSPAILAWLENQMNSVYMTSKKKINLTLVVNDIYAQPFLGKFLLKINYNFFSKTQLVDFIDSTALRKLSFEEKKYKFLVLIEKYLHNCEKRKFSAGYRKYLFGPKSIDRNQQKSSSQVIRLLLFIAIRSQNKDEFIQRIFILSSQCQQSLMDQIMQTENILENMTQKQELILQFNSMKDLNRQLKSGYQQLIDQQNILLDQCQKQNSNIKALQTKDLQNDQEKLRVCEQLNISDFQKPYLKIYKSVKQKNENLTRILIQKQKKQNQLQSQHLDLKHKSDEFEEVLFQLNCQRKKLKVVLNDKKNQSFQLEMRASLRLSQQKENLRKSQAMKKRSLAKGSALKDISNDFMLQSQNTHRLRVKSKHQQYSQMNQSVNVLAKIQELKNQKQFLMKELTDLNTENKKLKFKEGLGNNTLKQLSSIYSKILQLCPQFVNDKKILKKQRSKTALKVQNNRYFEEITNF